MTRPQLLMLDEPCAGLDPVAREHFLQFIDRLGHQRNTPAIVLITHHVEEIMPVFTHALLLRKGCDVAHGPVNRILKGSTLSQAFDCEVHIRRRQGRFWLTAQARRGSVL